VKDSTSIWYRKIPEINVWFPASSSKGIAYLFSINHPSPQSYFAKGEKMTLLKSHKVPKGVYLGVVMERGGSHEADDGRAIRIRHNRALPQPDVGHGLRVDLGDNERHLGVHPERGAVVHDDGAAGDGRGTVLPADAPAGAEERDVDAVEGPRRGEVLDGVLAVLEGEALPRGALAGQEAEAAVGEVPVRDDAEELLADRARGAHDGHGGPVLAQRHADGAGPAAGAAGARREEVRVADGGGGLHCGGAREAEAWGWVMGLALSIEFDLGCVCV